MASGSENHSKGAGKLKSRTRASMRKPQRYNNADQGELPF